jgi:hypothetical protein
MTMAAERAFLTTGQVGRHFHVPEWTIARLFTRGLLPEPARVGRFRVISEADLPAVRQALESAGYLHAAGQAGEGPAAGPGRRGRGGGAGKEV